MSLSVEKVKKSWFMYEEYLVKTRYAVREPESGKPLENNYDDVILRIINELKSDRKLPLVKKNSSSASDFDKLLLFLKERLIIPATPVLMSFGNPYTRRKGYFSCYPLGRVGDSMDGIRRMCEKMEIIYMHGGGCGIDISELRPKGSLVDNGQGVSSGPVGFLQKFDAITGTTNQGGRRRGALLVQMNWDHPDIMDFIKAKAAVPELSKVIFALPKEIRPEQNPLLSNMNISVNVFGDFFKNSALIDVIGDQMWKTGDPGLLFVDNMKLYSPFKSSDEPIFSNPCGEYLAPANTACNLITINLALIAKRVFSNPSNGAEGKFKEFFKNILEVSEAACVLGNVLIDCDEGYPLEEIKVATQYFRPIGIGVTGFHTALLYAFNGEVKYGDTKSVEFAQQIEAVLTYGCLGKSAELTEKNKKVYEWNTQFLDMHLKELNEALESFEHYFSGKECFEKYLKKIIDCADKSHGFYNSVLTSQPPTGTTSAFAHVAGDTGIEPMFSVELKRRVRDFHKQWITVDLVTESLTELIEQKPELKEKIEDQLAHRITPEEQLKVMAGFQKFIHTGVSKTVNVSKETNVEYIKSLIQKAKNFRLKGFTLFRDGCREDTIYITESKDKKIIYSDDLPPVRSAKVYEIHGPVNAYITTSFDEESILREVFISVGKAGTTLNSMFQAIGRLISVALRRYPDLADRFIQTLQGIESGEFYTCDGLRGNSLPDMLAKIIKNAIESQSGLEKGFKKSREKNIPGGPGDICPQCGNLAVFRSGGCKTCKICGYTTC